jgi:flagellin-like protein
MNGIRNTRRRLPRRGVSPIIATILLVAITVVIAAVLYVLVSGYLKGTSPAPLTIELQGEAPGHNAANTMHWLNFSVVTSSKGLDTGVFAFKIVNIQGNAVSGWSVSLIYNQAVVSTYVQGQDSWSTVVPVNASEFLSFNTGANSLVGSDDTIQAYGLSSEAISGGYPAL